MSSDTNDWRKNLTDADAAKVEAAAKAAYESRRHREEWGGEFSWTATSEVTRDGWLRDTLFTLRFAGVIPKPKPSRGEEFTASRIDVYGDAVRIYGKPTVVVNAPGRLDKLQLCERLKANIADAIDAERAAAFEVAAKIADEYRPGPTGLIISERIAQMIRRAAELERAAK
jgi:hypothetical protein